MGDNYDYGEVPVTGTVSSTNVTPEELIKMVKQIQDKVLKSNETNKEELLKSIQYEYSDFNISFPIVLKWMVLLGKFNMKAFKKYLEKHINTKCKTREDFLSLQAEYLVILYKTETPHASEKTIRDYRTQITKILIKEDKEFVEIQKEVDDEFNEKEKKADQERRQKIFEMLTKK
jgi:predicted RNase H-like HicB family nuclease